MACGLCSFQGGVVLKQIFRRWTAVAVLAVSALLLLSPQALAEDGRKIKTQIKPAYPDLANRMHVTGTVKIEVTIAPNGSVTNTKVIGGHPLLVQAALDAVKRWKYEAGPGETTQIVQFDFKGAQ